jgi:hypothetical protein
MKEYKVQISHIPRRDLAPNAASYRRAYFLNKSANVVQISYQNDVYRYMKEYKVRISHDRASAFEPWLSELRRRPCEQSAVVNFSTAFFNAAASARPRVETLILQRLRYPFNARAPSSRGTDVDMTFPLSANKKLNQNYFRGIIVCLKES